MEETDWLGVPFRRVTGGAAIFDRRLFEKNAAVLVRLVQGEIDSAWRDAQMNWQAVIADNKARIADGRLVVMAREGNGLAPLRDVPPRLVDALTRPSRGGEPWRAQGLAYWEPVVLDTVGVPLPVAAALYCPEESERQDELLEPCRMRAGVSSVRSKDEGLPPYLTGTLWWLDTPAKPDRRSVPDYAIKQAEIQRAVAAHRALADHVAAVRRAEEWIERAAAEGRLERIPGVGGEALYRPGSPPPISYIRLGSEARNELVEELSCRLIGFVKEKPDKKRFPKFGNRGLKKWICSNVVKDLPGKVFGQIWEAVVSAADRDVYSSPGTPQGKAEYPEWP